MTTTEERPLVRSATRRAAVRLMPLVVLLYFVNYLDRVNIGFAGPNGMNHELQLTATVFGLASGIFFIGYLILEVPSNLLLHRFGARRWIARILISWGVIATAVAFVPDATTLIVLRFLLGVAEAGFAPGIIVYLTYWFPTRQRGRMTAWFFTAVPISSALGSVVSTSIVRYADGFLGLSGWRVMFLVEGIPAILLAVVTWYLLTDRPRQARWMPADEQDALEQALAAEADRNAKVSPASIRKTLTNPRVLGLCWVYFGIVYGLYALSFFLPTIVLGFQRLYGTHYSKVEGGLITAVPYAVGLVVMLLWARPNGPTAPRRSKVVIPTAVGGVAIPIALYLQNPFLAMVAVTVCACGVLCALPMFWSLPTTQLSGAMAAAGVALINALGNLSGFVAPSVTGALLDVTGSNRAGLWVVGAAMVSAAVVVGFLRIRRPPTAVPEPEVV